MSAYDEPRMRAAVLKYTCPYCGATDSPCFAKRRDGRGLRSLEEFWPDWPFHQSRLDAFWKEHTTKEFLKL